MKIVVYAICKNEEKFVKRFMESVAEADEVYVLDTGSTDKTVELLLDCGAKVFEKQIKPWRFDTARNECLKLIPEDVDLCFSLDFDEVVEKGWRKKIEREYNQNLKQISYKYVWSHLASGEEGYVFAIDKIHARSNFVWKNAVHEVISYIGKSEDYQSKFINFQVDHYPDSEKSRSQYLPLLVLSVQEDPENDRNMHYLGREYMYCGKYEKCIETLEKHLKLKSATWADERSASMRYIAVSYLKLENYAQAEIWLLKAIAEAPNTREPYLYLAELYYVLGNFEGVLFFAERSLIIKERSLSYISEPLCYSSLPYDYSSIACYELGLFKKALERIEQAIMLSPNDERLKENKKKIIEKLNI